MTGPRVLVTEGRLSVPAIGVAMLLALGATGPALGQQPRPLNYTDYSRAAETEADRWWQHFWGEEREVQFQQPSFSAHYAIQRDALQQAFAIFHTSRLCEDIRTVNGVTLSKCPARLARFFPSGKAPDVVNLSDYVCVVRLGDAPPPPSDFGWNGAQVTLRKVDGQHVMILSAVLAGELITDCTTTIPLGSPA
jgi:hypothetical protein